MGTGQSLESGRTFLNPPEQCRGQPVLPEIRAGGGGGWRERQVLPLDSVCLLSALSLGRDEKNWPRDSAFTDRKAAK